MIKHTCESDSGTGWCPKCYDEGRGYGANLTGRDIRAAKHTDANVEMNIARSLQRAEWIAHGRDLERIRQRAVRAVVFSGGTVVGLLASLLMKWWEA